jgi:Raf kinase inhibitor-like YbhB/YbcL family protein
MRFTDTIKHGLGKVLRPVHAGSDKLASRRLAREKAPQLEVTSAAFATSQPIPQRYTKDGEDVSPPLRWSSPPPGTREVVVICEDPDAPFPKPFLHWMAYGIAPNVTELPEGLGKARDVDAPRLRQLRNSTRSDGWAGPAPPPGHGVHHYHFQVFALSDGLRDFAGHDREELIDAMRGKILAYGDLIGTYERV